MASLSIEDGNNSGAFGAVSSFGGGAFGSGSSIETGVPTVTTVPEKVEEVCLAPGGGGEQEGQDGKKKKNRCLSCKKKVGLTGKHVISVLFH